MRNKLWVCIALLLVVPGLLMTASCAKKAVKTDEGVTQASQEDTSAMDAERARRQAEEDAARRRQAELDAQRLAEEARQKELARARSLFVNEHIYFEFDKSDLTPQAVDVLKRKASWLSYNPGVAVVIEGHCDERGTNEYNLALGERRAQSARDFLVDMGVPASRLSTVSYGEERPLDPGHNETAWAKNRRAQFVLR